MEILNYLLDETALEEAQRRNFNGHDAIHYSALCRNRSAMQATMTALVNKGLTIRDFDVAGPGGPKGHLDGAINSINWSAALEILRRTQGNANKPGHDACHMLHFVVVGNPFGGRWKDRPWKDKFSFEDWYADYEAVIPALAARVNHIGFPDAQPDTICTLNDILPMACKNMDGYAVKTLLAAGMSTESKYNRSGKSRDGKWVIRPGSTPLVVIAGHASRPLNDICDCTMPLTALIRAGADFNNACVAGRVPLIHCLDSMAHCEGHYVPPFETMTREPVVTMIRETAKAGAREVIDQVFAWATWHTEFHSLRPMQALLMHLPAPGLLSKDNLNRLFKLSHEYESPWTFIHRDENCIMDYLVYYCQRHGLNNEIAHITTEWLKEIFYGGQGYGYKRFLCNHLLRFLDSSSCTLPIQGGPTPLVDIYVLSLGLCSPNLAELFKPEHSRLRRGWLFQIRGWPTPLHLAVKCPCPNAVRKCIEDGVNVNAVDWHGNTPIDLAVSLDQSSIARLLLDAGAYPHFHAKNYLGSAPLQPRGSQLVPIPFPGESDIYRIPTNSEFAMDALRRINERLAASPREENKTLEASAYEMAVEKGRNDPGMATLAALMIERYPYPPTNLAQVPGGKYYMYM
ncbi:hypothetical protein B0T19DRAFT_84444 [Cercophora scortea]|uniref:Ankyrin n=1 Tax=Cercophora scortea TaxID=314031 RepID=A0AAE0IUZ3_9PEZI|nr:hypothetical protein B0T19DRAFT_84444 [Cercophora scortea]